MESSKKILLSTIGIAILVVLLSGVTFAFFNYTRTGEANTIRVGRISFVTNQTDTINLTNLFPIDPTETGIMDDDTKVGTLEITIEGDTDYSNGIEYLVSSVESSIYTSQGQIVPISLDVTVDDLGTASPTYFTTRENTNVSIYKKLVGDTLVGDEMLLVGYIAPNNPTGTADGIDGSITIKAYLDKNKILISDTYDGTESDNMGTTNSMASGKTVITTSEWNALQSTGISFKVRVEANEGIWVIGSLEEIMRKSAVMDNINSTYVNNETPGINFKTSYSDTNGKGVYIRTGTENDTYPIMYYRGEVDNNVTFAGKCWKAVRTTDTGGVKLVYNGESSLLYNKKLDVSGYNNLTKVDVANVNQEYTFDNNDNTWTIVTSSKATSIIEFSVPTGSDYTLSVTGSISPSSSSSWASYSLYKDGSSVKSLNFNSSKPSFTYEFGNLSANNRIILEIDNGPDNTYTRTFKVQMLQNSNPLSENQYEVFTNSIPISKSIMFDDVNKKWTATVPANGTVKMNFEVESSKEYAIEYYLNKNHKYQRVGSGPIVIKNGTNEIVNDSIYTSTKLYRTKVGNIGNNNEFSVEFTNSSSAYSVTINFLVSTSQNDENGCDNLNDETYISLIENGNEVSEFMFNSNNKSLADAGYMYGDIYALSNEDVSNAYYASDFVYNNGMYTLSGDVSQVKKDERHYSCGTSGLTCATIRFYTTSNYYISLTDGENINDAIRKMQKNINDSIAKQKVDLWYEDNLIDYTNLLEDTIYCNDRSPLPTISWYQTDFMGDTNYGWWNTYGGGYEYLSMQRLQNLNVEPEPSFSCPHKNDSFTVKNTNGNNSLTYPIALLTGDEILASWGALGSNSFWSLSPRVSADEIGTQISIDISTYSLSNSVQGLRPSVSLKPGLPVVSGSGTIVDPYVIE